ncbi:MAG: hypothetical protein P4L76_12215 [Beijerinckiaceae bacterium]|nr:hypothetical protein [Beijerinckiaceae bacterium]
MSDALAPLTDRMAKAGTRLAVKAALLSAAALFFAIALIALIVAFYIWIAALAGPILAALAVAAVHLLAGTLVLVLALRDRRETVAPDAVAPEEASPAAEVREEVGQAVDPLLDLWRRSGGNPEQMAVLTATLLAKRAGPLSLVGTSLALGFVVGRFGTRLRALVDNRGTILETSAVVLPVLASLFEKISTPPPPRPPEA